ncbi:hypothetical protein T265_02560 [Opisthorchis viverrini]|uniref:Uncharacterized protein n=1 Tax=Opisthorchis viverrini TaxID=6198 RepID=A0A074ZUH3_OPIVI|nr:hypothetical protein T265_02560 [Opisthorchis viverrini]KER31108.1 hypothetical protein T265_02560 [Opisthorchis viverrini]
MNFHAYRSRKTRGAVETGKRSVALNYGECKTDLSFQQNLALYSISRGSQVFSYGCRLAPPLTRKRGHTQNSDLSRLVCLGVLDHFNGAWVFDLLVYDALTDDSPWKSLLRVPIHENDQEIQILESQYHCKYNNIHIQHTSTDSPPRYNYQPEDKAQFTSPQNRYRHNQADIDGEQPQKSQCPIKVRKSYKNSSVKQGGFSSSGQGESVWGLAVTWGWKREHTVDKLSSTPPPKTPADFPPSSYGHSWLKYFTYPKFRVDLHQYAKRELLTRQLPVVSLYAMSSKTHLPPAES